jgi:hypothetical protein
VPSVSLPTTRLFAFVAIAICAEARAGVFFHRGRSSPAPGAPRSIPHTDDRAGHPRVVSPLAHPTRSPNYQSGYVGGGVAWGGDARYSEEGTWGRDYTGSVLPRRVFLRWGHGRSAQGGTGSYATDGHPVPDVIGRALTHPGPPESQSAAPIR